VFLTWNIFYPLRLSFALLLHLGLQENWAFGNADIKWFFQVVKTSFIHDFKPLSKCWQTNFISVVNEKRKLHKAWLCVIWNHFYPVRFPIQWRSILRLGTNWACGNADMKLFLPNLCHLLDSLLHCCFI
jgi:hypothetical protein